MSKVRSDNISNRADDGAPALVYGAEVPVGYGITGAGGINITGVATATSFSGNVTGNISGGTVAGSTGSFTGDVDIADKIIHTGDTNTAIRFPAADTFTIETGGTEALRVDSNRRLLLGDTSAREVGTIDGLLARIAIETPNDIGAGLNIVWNRSQDTYGPRIRLGKSRTATVGGSTIVQDDDELGTIQFCGADGTDLTNLGAKIQCKVDGTPGSNDMPGRLMFFTSADGSGSPTERLRITSAGEVQIANGNLKLSTAGTGIDFSAAGNAGGMTSELLDDYEEGTFTPTIQNFSTTGSNTLTGRYVKVGKQVTIGIQWNCTGTITHGVSALISLPFAPTASTGANGLIGMLVNSNSSAFNSNKTGVQCKIDTEGAARFFPGSFTATSTGEGLLFGGTYISAT